MKKPWSGRFAGQTDIRVEMFTQSISCDYRLFKQDIRASIAHAHMLAKVSLITSEECQQIVRTLSDIDAEIENGTLLLWPELEDIHMNIESVLIERLGDTGASCILHGVGTIKSSRISNYGLAKH